MKWVFTYAQLWNIWDGPLGFSNQIINIFISDGSSTGSYYLALARTPIPPYHGRP